MPHNPKKIRNFAIIAHIDHGKSTLSDRIIEKCQNLSNRDKKQQMLDSMDLERERGITIKAQACRLYFKYQEEDYQINLIDTPGHVDFSYEVSRSLAACEGALLVVDATQGVEAQTVANCTTAAMLDLNIIPVINKMDMPQADPERVKKEIEEIIGIDASNSILCSAKSGMGIDDLMEAIITRLPSVAIPESDEFQALIMDSWFDSYLGVVSLIKVISGSISKGDRITIMSTKISHYIDQIGYFSPNKVPTNILNVGEVGYLVASIKEIDGAPVGDTIIRHGSKNIKQLAGFQKVQPKVFSGLFPTNGDDYENLRQALQKLRLNDASLFFEPESSKALGFGFRCGFLGMLHMDIIQERLEREYDMDLITTAPTVVYEVLLTNNDIISIDNPSQLPANNEIAELREPLVVVTILVPNEYLGNIIKLCIERRGIQKNLQYIGNQINVEFIIPQAEVVFGFYDKLKSISRGMASMDYEFLRNEAADLVKIDILINKELVDALSIIVHRSQSIFRGRDLVDKMQGLIPRQMFEVAIQATCGGKIIARQTVKALRKNVTAKCYGGDVSRKKKLLEKQKAGKKRMKRLGQVDLPQEAFLAILKVDK